jgi:MFS family permease
MEGRALERSAYRDSFGRNDFGRNDFGQNDLGLGGIGAAAVPRQRGTLGIEAPCLAIAALGCLQPAIDPVFLTLLSDHDGLSSDWHGWIVGATQTGMALGSVAVWRLGTRLPARATPLAAIGALLACLATLMAPDPATLIAARAAFGLAMGIIYTRAMSEAAILRPTGAYAAVLLIQLVLATLASMLLPAVAARGGAGPALAMLALVPALVLAIALRSARRPVASAAALPEAARTVSRPTPIAGWAMAAATFFFICGTMMVWSFAGALAVAAGFSDEIIGTGVAIGSVAGAVTAMLVMRERPIVPLLLTGLASAVALLSPLFLIVEGRDDLFLLAFLLLNIASTAMIVRCSGLATAIGGSPLFARLVAGTHPLGMIAGPSIGSFAAMTAGGQGLRVAAMFALAAGCLALVVAAVDRRRSRRDASPVFVLAMHEAADDRGGILRDRKPTVAGADRCDRARKNRLTNF